MLGLALRGGVLDLLRERLHLGPALRRWGTGSARFWAAEERRLAVTSVTVPGAEGGSEHGANWQNWLCARRYSDRNLVHNRLFVLK